MMEFNIMPARRARMKKMLVMTASAMMVTGPVSHAEPLTQYVDDFFYELGGGRAIPRGAAGYVTYRIGARFTVTPGYSCGNFSLEQNLEQALNRIRTQVQGLPDQLGTAATNMISALPMYLVKNYASDIYGILMWNLDQSIDLFRVQYKTCETLEAEIMNNDNGYNPYATATRAAVMNQYIWGGENGQTIDETTRDIQTNPGRRGFNFLGDGRGTAARPIPLKHDLMVLAYNNRIGRVSNPLDVSAPTTHQNEALVQTWRSPQHAADWLVAATGEFWLVADSSAPKESAPGIGLRPEIDMLTDHYVIALTNAAELNNYDDLDALELGGVPNKLRLSDRVIESIQALKGDKRAIAIERLASDTAVAIVKNKVDLATTLLRAAIQDPDVATSQISGVAGQVALQARTWLREEMEEISQMMAIDRMGPASTPVIIMNRGMQEGSRGGSQTGRAETHRHQTGRDGFPDN